MNFNKLSATSKWLSYDDEAILKTKLEKLKLPLTDEDKKVIDKMISYIEDSFNSNYKKSKIRPGIAIAANQVGYYKRIVYIHFIDENKIERKYLLANPEILSFSYNKSFLINGEGCLSVKQDYQGYSIRHEKIVVQAIDLFNNKEIQINAQGLFAICLQHEIDHLDGILFYDRINKLDPFYYKKEWKKI